MPETYYEVGRFKFGDIVNHWGRERLVHDVLVSRELARGVVREGLRFESVDPKWTKPSESLRGEPLVGFSSRQEIPPIMIRAEALEHLLKVEREDRDVDLKLLHSKYVTKADFRQWLIHTGKPLPEFWYMQYERYKKA